MGTLAVDGFATLRGRSPRRLNSSLARADRGASRLSTSTRATVRRWLAQPCKWVLQAAPAREGTGRATPELVLEAPLSGATVGATVELRGRISAMPFEKNLSYRIYNQAGTIVGEGAMLLEGPFDGPGTFAESIAITGTTAPGILRIEVGEGSVVDGSLIVSTSVEVWFAGGS